MASQQFTGNNQQVLLEQLEQQGIRVPYSCRAGICGSCRIRLEGEVPESVKENAVAGDGTILPAAACRKRRCAGALNRLPGLQLTALCAAAACRS